MKISFGDYLPDLPALDNPGSSYIRNVIPARLSYRPMPSLSVYSGALTARCQGAVAVTDLDGNVVNFAGDATTLYNLAAGTTTWNDASKAGGYNTASEGRWAFAQYKQQVIATNGVEAIQEYTLNSSTDFADLDASAPLARYLAVAKAFLFAVNTSTDPQRIHWSAIDDPSNWPTPGSAAAVAVQSDYQDLVGDGGWNMGAIGGLSGADLVVWQERSMWRGTYVGGDLFWQFDQVEGGRGTPAPGSIVQVGGLAYYLGEDGFYRTDGASSEPIGADKIDKTFFADLDQSRFDRISSAADPINKIVIWAYASTASTDGRCDRLLVYNWQSGRWSLIDAVECELIFRSLSFGYTMESLDAISADLDALPFSLDSRAWTGGRLLLSAFDTNHKLDYFTGSNLAATLETTEAQPIPNMRAVVTEVWPLVDGGTLTVTPVTRNRNNDAPTTGTAASQNSIGYCPVRTNARYHRYRVGVASAGTWTHAQGINVPEDKVSAGGAR